MSVIPLTAGLLEEDIKTVLAGMGNLTTDIEYSVVIHTPNEDIEVRFLILVEVLKDYVNNSTDYILVTFLLGLGDYIKDVHPYGDNLEASLTRKNKGDEVTIKYKLVISNTNEGVNGSIYTSSSKDYLNSLDMITLEVQLYPLIIEGLRNTPVGDIYNYVSVGNLIQAELMEAVSSLTIGGNTPDVMFDMIPPDNTKEYRHINVPPGDVKILDLPGYLQDMHYGVYNHGLGFYFQPLGLKDGESYLDTFFMYPLHNTLRFDEDVVKLIILSHPTNQLTYSENSYTIDGNLIKIIGSGEVKSIDDNDNTINNHGSSFITYDPESIISGQKDITNDKVTNNPNQYISGHANRSKKDGVDVPVFTGVTTNTFKHYSDLAKSDLSLYQIQWHNANPELLYPGMPVSYVYHDENKGVFRLTGILQSVFSRFDNNVKNTSCMLNVMLSKPTVIGDKDNSIDLR